VLILDEPTANVDRSTAEPLVKDMLAAARAKPGRAIVLITHSDELSSLADKALILKSRN
jgi:ABC-type lipoprotein export system ATPase subunit